MTINWEVIIWTCITLAVLMSVIGLILYAISAKNVRSKRKELGEVCLLYTSPSPRDQRGSRMPSSA